MKLGPGETLIFEGHPCWRAILDYYIKGAIAVAALAALVGLGTSLFGDGVATVPVILVVAIGVAIVIVAGFLKRVATRYTITNRRLNVRHGIISRDVQETRLERVQDVRYTQSVLQRILQIGNVDFDTASDDPTDFVFAGVAAPDEVVELVHAATSGGSGLGDDEPER